MSNGQYSLLNTRAMSSTRAMRAFKRAKEIERLGIKRKAAPLKPQADFVNNEMVIPGESRSHSLLYLRCADSHREGSKLEVKYPHGQDVAYYRVVCLNPDCEQETPWLPSSQAAIQLWKVTAALVK